MRREEKREETNLEKWVPRSLGTQKVAPQRVVGPTFRALFFPLPSHFRSFCVFLGVFSLNFGVVF